jgi:cyclic beta-1,2-glucan synthetase
MFEYLMPSLVLDEPHGSVLRDACLGAIREQIDFAAAQGVPWGISESAYAGRDHTLAYQYAPQGVPRLALRRTPPDELVVAPYATALAAQLAPRRAVSNFGALEHILPRATYGFIEALDFSPARQTGNEACTPVSTFMAHHQGMSIVALANVLLDGPAQRWGMANPHIEAVSSLLHERAPRELPRLYAQPSGPPAQGLRRRAPGLLRQVVPGETAIEPTHMLSNGRYGVLLRANGAGASHWGQTGLTRSRDDALRDAFGSFFYVRRDAQQALASITQHPAPDPAAQYQSTYHADRVCFDAAWPDLQAHTTVWVSPEDDIEFRQVELRNLTDRPIDIELVSAFEVTLTEARADEAHPAFTGLFVQARWQASHQALVFERKPRLSTEQGLLAAHFLADTDPQVVDVRVQTDRQRWLGRNQDTSQPAGAFDPPPNVPSGITESGAAPDDNASTGLDTGLDPVCALSVRLRIAPHTKAQLTFATAASSSGSTLHAVIDKYRQPSHVQRASLMSATLTSIRLRTLRISPLDFAAVQTLTTALVLSLTRPPASTPPAPGGASDVCDRRLLWRFGISGDRPILLVSAGVPQGLGLLRSLAQALSLWCWSGVACDLVVVNAEPASYLRPLHREIAALRDRHGAESSGQTGPVVTGFHLLNAEELSGDELGTLHNLARVRLQADGRPLVHHVQEWSAAHELALAQRQDRSSTAVAIAAAPPAGATAPVGEFDGASGEFHFDAGTSRRPLRPWINVLANPAFGAQISEAGGGCTWALNSRLNQLTAWSNDPVADPPAEWLLLQDRRTRDIWSATPCARGGASQVLYHVTHGQGYTAIRHRRGDVEVTVSWCVDAHTSVKQIHLQLFNHGHKTQHLRVTGLVEWMMGANRSDRSTVRTALYRQRLPDRLTPAAQGGAPRSQKLTALLCTQQDRTAGFGQGTAFFSGVGGTEEAEDWTCDRREFFDARGRLVLPDHLSQHSGSGFDPCAAISTQVTLGAGLADERVFLLGYAESADAARALATIAATLPPAQRLEESRTRWNLLLGATTVSTPDPLLDVLVNRWLLYQAVSCRLWAKAGFYQAGGATGFRDQLQDAMALAWAAPEMLRAQIVLCASRQFVEGDVQHWWHAPLGAGVRTHFSDDLLWLPHACAHYLRTTGDATLLDQPVPFIEGTVIPEGAEDAYNTPTASAEEATVYEHAARTIDRSLRVGAHGLPLMGSGDWNDGMNRVGIAGRGESVWLGWFLCQLVTDFAPLARARGEIARAQRWEAAAEGWTAALDGPAWDGQWYKRAFFDNGQPLGSHANAEARIDLIAQAWAVLSGVAPPDRQRMAMAAVEAHLVDPDAGLIKLLDPPLVHAVPSAGYIQAYPPGVRENGVQYTHAGIWALMAQARLAQAPQATAADAEGPYRSFTFLSPAHRAAHPTRGPVYGVEPYVVAADVYTQPPYVGRGGWSWYTGAAAWLHRAAVEALFGLRHDAQRLRFTPCLPAHWPRAEMTLVRDGRTMRFILLRAATPEALAATAPPGAQVLQPGEWLHWTRLPADTCFVIAVQDLPAHVAAPSPGMQPLEP